MFPVDSRGRGIYRDLMSLLPDLAQSSPTSVSTLNRLRVKIQPDLLAQYCFIEQTEQFDWQDQYYEQVIFSRGEIPTRMDNWHDVFNAAMWLLFPKTKIYLNQLHIADINKHGLTPRSPHRNAITFLDECGVIVASCDASLITALRQHQWVQAFAESRHRWFESIRAFMIGHGNYETALSPFLGFTGKMLPLEVAPEFFHLPLSAQYQTIDSSLVEAIKSKQLLNDNSHLSPFPILGVPTWYDDNKQVGFYHNTDYFRPKPRDKGKVND